MSAKLTIVKINFTTPPSGQQTCTVKYQKIDPAGEPVITSANNIAVGVDGTLLIPHVIAGLTEGAGYRIFGINNCNGEEFSQVVYAASQTCPDCIGVIGSVEAVAGGGGGEGPHIVDNQTNLFGNYVLDFNNGWQQATGNLLANSQVHFECADAIDIPVLVTLAIGGAPNSIKIIETSTNTERLPSSQVGPYTWLFEHVNVAGDLVLEIT